MIIGQSKSTLGSSILPYSNGSALWFLLLSYTKVTNSPVCLCVCVCVCVSSSVVSVSVNHCLEAARLLCPWNSPGKNTGVDYHSLLQRIFPTQELNLGLLHCRQILYRLSYERSPLVVIGPWKNIFKFLV